MDPKSEMSSSKTGQSLNQKLPLDFNEVLDPEKTSVQELEEYFGQLEEDLQYEEVSSIIDGFECNEEYKTKYPDHHEVLIYHNAVANMEIKTSQSVDRAKLLFKQAIELYPESKLTKKYFSLAELSSGQEAIDIYKRGLDICQIKLGELQKLQNEYEMTMQTTDIDISCEMKPVITKEDYETTKVGIVDLQEQIQGVYTAMGEIYLADLTDNPNYLQIALTYAEEACKLGNDLEALLLKFNTYFVQYQKKDADEFPNALQNARDTVKEVTLLILSKQVSDLEINVIRKCVESAIFVDCFVESFSILMEVEKTVGGNNEILLSMWATHHHSSAVYHLKGFHHYSTRLIEVINGLEVSHEVSDETEELKAWIKDLNEQTLPSVTTGENVDNEDFVEMTYPSSLVGSGSGSTMPEVLNSDEEESEDGEDQLSEDDDDSCVIIDEVQYEPEHDDVLYSGTVNLEEPCPEFVTAVDSNVVEDPLGPKLETIETENNDVTNGQLNGQQ